ncbi:hypothetical protein ACQKL6_17170 [Peribacillus sp. NPDC097197]|uniref:hypothetical protein n=1 Tax=Peribacillus sp. NPDC097197 TaxID=3390615 RepID=UPI003D07FE0F
MKIVIAVMRQSARLLYSITAKIISETITIAHANPAAVVSRNLYCAFLMSFLKFSPRNLAQSEKFVY